MISRSDVQKIMRSITEGTDAATLQPIAEHWDSLDSSIRDQVIETLKHDSIACTRVVTYLMGKRSSNRVIPSILERVITDLGSCAADALFEYLSHASYHEVAYAICNISMVDSAYVRERVVVYEDSLDSYSVAIAITLRATLCDDHVRDELLRNLYSGDDRIKMLSITGLGYLADESTVPALISVLHDPNDIIREQVIVVLRQIGGADAIVAITTMLDDPDSDVREFAVWALGELQAASAIHPLVTRLHREPDSYIRGKILESLLLMGMQDANREVINVLLTDADPSNRVMAAIALEELYPFPETRDALVRALDDQDNEVSCTAAGRLEHFEVDAETEKKIRAILTR